jgi:hypothetical protein
MDYINGKKGALMTQLLFYENTTPVSAERHKDLTVKSGLNYGFAKKVNSVPLTAVEFAQAAAEYPIVFAAGGESVMPAVILGVQNSENLYVDESGAWQGKYIPAFVRRYPFVFSTENTGKRFILNVDESYAGCNREGRGERLFDNDGQQTQYLKSVLNFLQDYQGKFARTKQYCDRLKSLGLLQSMQVQFNLTTGEQRSLSGFMTVDREKLKAIPTEDLETMFRNDELDCTYLHLQSLRHFRGMIERMPAGVADEGAASNGADDAELDIKKPAKNGRSVKSDGQTGRLDS